MRKANTYLGLLIPMGIFLLHSYFYKDWLVDDAAISIAYALNLADGHGLVSQAGRSPVEAYSNPLWVFLLSLFKKAGLWQLYATPKILAISCVLIAKVLVYRLLDLRFGLGRIASLFLLSLISINAPFVCWVNAGLENGLFVLGISLMLFCLLTERSPLPAGLVMGALGLVRPEALLFASLGLVFLLTNGKRKWARNLVVLIFGFAISYGTYLLFRLNYFGEWLPNPFFVKAGQGLWETNYLLKLHHLFRSIFGPLGGLGAVLSLAGSLWFLKKRTGESQGLYFFAAWMLSILSFLVLPYDHLGWYRYATGFIWLGYLWMGIAAWEAWKRMEANDGRTRLGLQIFVGIFALASLAMGAWISQKRMAAPPVPYKEVADRYGHGFNEVARELGLEAGAILVPDIGGTLLHARLQAYDFPGLIDPVIARSYQRDSARFTDYIFEEIQPVLIGSHGLWLEDKDWQNDPRLARDYEVYRRINEGKWDEEVIWRRKKK